MREALDAMWAMVRSNELYTKEMFIDDMLGKIKSELEKCVPSSNRKSCDKSEHYMSRYKEGWNQCRSSMLEAIREKWGMSE